MPRNDKRLDVFTLAYIETMLWATNDESDDGGGEPIDANYGPDDIAPETMELIVEDCADFQERFGHLIEDEPEVQGEDRWNRWELAGHDFWLTRTESGAGFWDGDWPEHGDELSDASKAYGSFDLTVDDGVIYGPDAEWYREHRKPKPVASEARRARHVVRDFGTLPELVEHAGQQDGATHVVVLGKKASLFYPTGRYWPSGEPQYEAGKVWHQGGYWHSVAPSARSPLTGGLPGGAESIEAYLTRSGHRTAESSRQDPNPIKAKHIDRKRLGEMMSPWGGDGDLGINAVGSYYYGGHAYPDRDYVEGAIRQAEDFIPMAERGEYGWTKKDARDLRTIVAGLRYYLERDYGEGGALIAKEAFGRSAAWPDWQILDAIDKGHALPPESERRAVKLAQLGFIDTTGTWRLTAKGRRAIEQQVPIAAEYESRRTLRETWVPPNIAHDGITPTMLELVLDGVGSHAKLRPGQSVVYDRAYAALRDGGYVVLKRATPGLSSGGDYYVLTDKGADLVGRYRLEIRKAGASWGSKAGESPRRRRSR